MPSRSATLSVTTPMAVSAASNSVISSSTAAPHRLFGGHRLGEHLLVAPRDRRVGVVPEGRDAAVALALVKPHRLWLAFAGLENEPPPPEGAGVILESSQQRDRDAGAAAAGLHVHPLDLAVLGVESSQSGASHWAAIV